VTPIVVAVMEEKKSRERKVMRENELDIVTGFV